MIDPPTTSQAWPESRWYAIEGSVGPYSGTGNTIVTHLTWAENPYNFLQSMLSPEYGSSDQSTGYPGDLEDCSSELTSPEEPAISYEVTSPSGDSQVFCLWSDCLAKPFRRAADLKRHYKNVHCLESNENQYCCDWPKCEEQFNRHDHFREHLRKYHCEDIPKLRENIGDGWFEDRYISPTWWRCRGCLIRVTISELGFRCPKCKFECEQERCKKRKKKSAKARGRRLTSSPKIAVTTT